MTKRPHKKPIVDLVGEKLHPKQTAFVCEYLTNGYNAEEAAKTAGYSEKSAKSIGYQLLHHPIIAKAVANVQTKAATKALVTVEEIVQDAKKIKSRCMEAEAVLDRAGNPIGEYKFDSRGAIAANDQLAKIIGAYAAEKRELTGANGGPIKTEMIDLSTLSVEKLEALQKILEG